MKINKSLLILFALLISQFSFSQNNSTIISGDKAHQIAPGAELIRIKPFSEVPNYIRFAPGKSISENKAFPYLKQFINSDAVDFTFLNSSRDKLGLEHKRFTQKHSRNSIGIFCLHFAYKEQSGYFNEWKHCFPS